METKPAFKTNITRVNKKGSEDTEDLLAIEAPLEIRMAYTKNNELFQKNISVTMRTPGNDEPLAAGFLFTEGIIKDRKDITQVSVNTLEENIVTVKLKDNIEPFLQNTERNFYTTSSCGVCGKASIDAIKTISVYPEKQQDMIIDGNLFYSLPDQLKKEQAVFQKTGGLHAAALFDKRGQIFLMHEDIGRHNALDKIIGAALLNDQLPLFDAILLLSGRISFELVQKANMAGIKIIAAVGAPSSLAVELAVECGITLVGFLREEKYNIYSGRQRIHVPVNIID
ncbi:MAG: formate dehydrogenase accessory sulfurtransferase FdhD [Ferruginibacter sp.]